MTQFFSTLLYFCFSSALSLEILLLLLHLDRVIILYGFVLKSSWISGTGC